MGANLEPLPLCCSTEPLARMTASRRSPQTQPMYCTPRPSLGLPIPTFFNDSLRLGWTSQGSTTKKSRKTVTPETLPHDSDSFHHERVHVRARKPSSPTPSHCASSWTSPATELSCDNVFHNGVDKHALVIGRINLLPVSHKTTGWRDFHGCLWRSEYERAQQNHALESQLNIWMHFHGNCVNFFHESRSVENNSECSKITLWRDGSKSECAKFFHEPWSVKNNSECSKITL